MTDEDHARSETPAERMDRHWNEMLQELRVTQTGVQVIFAFLLILPFQQRFQEVDDFSRRLYVVVVCLVAVSAVLTLAPVITHRFLYAKHKRDMLLTVADWFTKTAFVTIGLALTGALLLALDMVIDRQAAMVTAAVGAVLLLLVWVVVPIALLRAGGGERNY